MTEKNNIRGSDVSIIVPLFHGEKYLDNIIRMTNRNIESASNINIELILVNDSPDDVPDFSLLKRIGCPTNIVLNEINLGIQCARLQGVKHSHGKYLFFLDQDDVVSDDIIIRLFNAANGGEVSLSDWEKELSGNDGIYSVDRIADIKYFTLKKICTDGNIIGPLGHCLIRRDCLPICWTKRIMRINGADDVLFWMGMLAENRRFYHCDGKLYVHKWHSECFSNDTLKMLVSEEEAFDIAAKEYKISTFWRAVHKRNIKYRRFVCTASKRGYNYEFIKRIGLLLYPEILMIHILNKAGIHVG